MWLPTNKVEEMKATVRNDDQVKLDMLQHMAQRPYCKLHLCPPQSHLTIHDSRFTIHDSRLRAERERQSTFRLTRITRDLNLNVSVFDTVTWQTIGVSIIHRTIKRVDWTKTERRMHRGTIQSPLLHDDAHAIAVFKCRTRILTRRRK